MDTRRIWKKFPEYGIIALVLCLMMVEWLRGGPLSFNLPHSLQSLRANAVELSLSKTAQSAGAILLFIYHLFLLWVKAAGKRLSADIQLEWWRLFDSRDWCKFVIVVCTLFGYTIDWRAAPESGTPRFLISGIDQSTNVLVFLTGIVLSQIVEVVAQKNDRLRLFFGQTSLIALIVFLSAASLTRHEGAQAFKYVGQMRATGLWINPNTYGLLMGTGLILALAYLAEVWRDRSINGSNESPYDQGNMQGAESAPTAAPPIPMVLRLCFAGGAAILLAVGLICSYSRGAWLGAMVGIAYLGSIMFRSPSTFANSWVSRLYVPMNWLRQNIWIGVVLCSSLAILMMFRAMHSEHLLLRRFASIANANDFSWRNRIVAWKGALQIIADHPFAGVGWHRVSHEFQEFYAPPRLAEHWSIILNDYLTLGMVLGIPALACFVALLRVSFHDYLAAGGRWEWVVAASRSALIVLAIGFWFDGGLFKLALATPFWLFVELAALRKHPYSR